MSNLVGLARGQALGHACAMDLLPPPLAFVVLLFAGWVNRQQQAVIDYLLEENRVLRAAHGPRRLRLTDDQRRRLAAKGKVLGRRRLAGIVGIVTPDTILRWYRALHLICSPLQCAAATIPVAPTPELAAVCYRPKTLLMTAREHALLAGVNVSAAYAWWPVFRCPSMAGFGCPPRVSDSVAAVRGGARTQRTSSAGPLRALSFANTAQCRAP